jgi:hypothetical protein
LKVSIFLGLAKTLSDPQIYIPYTKG